MQTKKIRRGIYLVMVAVCFFSFILTFPGYAATQNLSLHIDGQGVKLDVPPYIDNQSRTIVPLRFIGEELGYNFAWDGQAKQVDFTGGGNSITLTVGSRQARVNGSNKLLDTEAVIKNGRTMVPLRFVLENLGVQVHYDSTTRVVNIITKEKAPSQTATGKTAIISENSVNVRKGPGTTYSILTQVKKGDTFQVLEQSSDWYQIALNDTTPGWVAGWLVTLRGETAGASRGEEPGSGRETGSIPENLVAIKDVTVDVIQGEVYFKVQGEKKLDYAIFNLDNPKRLVVDFFNSELETHKVKAKNFPVETDLVAGVRLAQFSEKQVRIVVDVTSSAGLEIINDTAAETTFKVGKPSIVGKTIVIDPGHGEIKSWGSSDPGAIGPSNLYERDVVLDIAQKTKTLLEAKGAKVIMTRTGDTSLSLNGRADLANKNGADIFVSIHTNANTSRNVHGSSTYYYDCVAGQLEARQRLAKAIQEEIVKTAGRRNIGVLQGNFAVLRNTKMPSVLVETAFISNYEEEKLLADPAFRQKMANGIAQGIEKYFTF